MFRSPSIDPQVRLNMDESKGGTLLFLVLSLAKDNIDLEVEKGAPYGVHIIDTYQLARWWQPEKTTG